MVLRVDGRLRDAIQIGKSNPVEKQLLLSANPAELGLPADLSGEDLIINARSREVPATGLIAGIETSLKSPPGKSKLTSREYLSEARGGNHKKRPENGPNPEDWNFRGEEERLSDAHRRFRT